MKNQPSKKAEPREFWIEIWKEHPMNDLIIQRPVGNRQFPKSYAADELVHTIEYSAHAQLMEAAEALAKALKMYNDPANYSVRCCDLGWAADALEKFEAFKKAGGK